jgi:hypothetical protein
MYVTGKDLEGNRLAHPDIFPDSQSACFGVEPLVVFMTRRLLLGDGYCRVVVGHPL